MLRNITINLILRKITLKCGLVDLFLIYIYILLGAKTYLLYKQNEFWTRFHLKKEYSLQIFAKLCFPLFV